MSETTTETTQATAPGRFRDGAELTRTDAKGRIIKMQQLSLWEEMELIATAGSERAANPRWMMYATMASCVRYIDGTPIPRMASRNAIETVVKMVGSEGVAAVAMVLASEMDDAEAGEVERVADVAKN